MLQEYDFLVFFLFTVKKLGDDKVTWLYLPLQSNKSLA